MRFLFSENVDSVCAATLTMLKALKIKVTKTTVVETVQNHPNFPSLLSISDALKCWEINNSVIQVASEQLRELPVPFITQIEKKDERIFVTVLECNDTYIIYKEHVGSSVLKIHISEFEQKWSGIALLSEIQANSGEKNYSLKRRIELFHQLKVPIAICLFLFLGGLIIYTKYFVLQHSFAIVLLLFTIVKLCGIAVTAILLIYEIDKNNSVIQKICTIGSHTNCNSILQSKAAKVFNLVSWSEVGFFYFMGTFLSLLFSKVNTVYDILLILPFLNIVALPYTLFSVFYQWRVAKQWCVLCLCVQFLLLAEGFITFMFRLHPFQNIVSAFSISTMTTFFIAFIIPVLSWFIIKPFLFQAQEGKSIRRNLLRLKFDTEIFSVLLAKQKFISDDDMGDLGIIIGNPDASNTLTIVSNPDCRACVTLHTKLKILLEYHDMKVRVIFRINPQKEARFELPIIHLLAIAAERGKNFTEKALNDWYLTDKKDYVTFANKYPLRKGLEEQKVKLNAMTSWCLKMNIDHTPMIFINGYELPPLYDIHEVPYFFNE